MDYSKASAFHRLYGHDEFAKEMAKQKKTRVFVLTICSGVNCKTPHYAGPTTTK